MPINLLLAIGSEALLDRLSKLIGREKNFSVLKTVNSLAEIKTALAELNPAVLVIDEELEDKSGYEAILEIMRIKPIATLMILHGERSIYREKYIKATKYGIVEEAYLDLERELDYLPSDFLVKLTILSKLNLDRFQAQIDQLNRGDDSTRSMSISKPEKTIVKRASPVQEVEKLVVKPPITKPESAFMAKIPKSRQVDTVIIIGASTGGPKTLTHLISTLPTDCPPVIVVQHMPEYFVENFARRINNHTNLSVVVGDTGDRVVPGNIYVAPGGYHLEFRRIEGKPRIVITDGPKINFVKPAVDVTLFSAAKHYREKIISVILTGMGSDGTEGSRMVKSLGGRVIALNETDSILYGMNKSVIDAGLADFVCSIDEIAPKIIQILRS